MTLREERRAVRTICVVSSVVHHRHEGRLFAFGPYAREIDAWADLFEGVCISAPASDAAPPGDALPFLRPNIRLDPLPRTGGDRCGLKAAQLFQLPHLVWLLARSMRSADAVHVRCPGNVGLLGALLGPLCSNYRIARYAGQWNGYAGEPLSVRLQRGVLGSRWWNAPVTVYGSWPGQASHVVPFFTSMMTADQVRAAVSIAPHKTLEGGLRVVYSGRLVPVKRVDALIQALALARDSGVACELALVGDGPERAALERLAVELGLGGAVRFAGAIELDQVMRWYAWGNCLVLPSQHSEGWPKAVAEAMCHGLLCMAVDHGQMRSMLEGRGVLLADGSPREIADALANVAADPGIHQALARAGCEWSGRYSLDGLRLELGRLLETAWGVRLGA